MTTMLQHLRETAKLSQRDLAARAKVTQETISQVETGKSTRPRLDTLTKLRDALELGDMRPEDLLELSPLSTDPHLDAAATTMITLLKVLPPYEPDPRDAEFWWKLSEHLGYQDLYPATHLHSHLKSAVAQAYGSSATDLAEYVLMFFDPEDEKTNEILADRIGPHTQVARRWSRDLTDAAWVLHRAAMTSYPQQVGQLYAEAGETEDPARLRELCGSVYATVRAVAYQRADVDEQIAALRTDPSDEVHYGIAKAGGPEVQCAAVAVPTAWIGLANNRALDPDVAEQLLTTVVDELLGDHGRDAGFALHTLADRSDLPRPLLERLRAAIDGHPENEGGWVNSSILAVGRTLRGLDQEDARRAADDARGEPRPALRVVTDEDAQPTAWWRRFLSR